MWRLRSLVVLGVLAGTLILGAMVAQGSWWWNSTVDVEGSELRTIWEVVDGADNPYSYTADFTVSVPKMANATLVQQSTNETITIKKSKKLSCLSDGIQVGVSGTVSASNGAPGTQAKIILVDVASGSILSQSTGPLGQSIDQAVLLPGTCGGSDSDGAGSNGNGGGGKGKNK